MKDTKTFYSQYKKIIIPSVLILLSIFLIFGVIFPQISIISVSNAQIKQANEQIDTLEESLSVVQNSDSNQLSDDLLTVTNALPTSKDVSLIFNALNNTANVSSVSLDEFSLKVGGIFGKTEDAAGVSGVPSVTVNVRTSGSASSTVLFAKGLQEALPLSEIKLVEMNEDDASYDVNFFYKPLALSVFKQEKVTPLTQADLNLINQLKSWDNQ